MIASRRIQYVYLLLTDKGTLHTGQVNDLHLAANRHRMKERPGEYDPKRLVYYETFPDEESAKRRAKEIKGFSRKKKLELISPRILD